MVWACFWGGGQSDLFILNRDFESKKMGYSAKSYLEVIEDQLPRCWSPGLTFMQDNAPIYKAKAVLKWFVDSSIPLMDWPPYSPDLNPIEHAWYHLKRKVLEIHPELLRARGKKEEDIKQLENALVEAWSQLPESLFDALIDSMPRRVVACIAAKGWHTKY